MMYIGKTGNSLISTTPLQFDDSNLRNSFDYLQIIYIAKNDSHWACISNADSMALCLLLFAQLFLKVKRSESSSAGRKRILIWNSRSGSFYVIHFAINHRPTRGSISSYIIVGLIGFRRSSRSNRQKIAVVDNPTLDAPRQEEPPWISACTLYFQKLEPLAYILVADSMGLSAFTFVQCAPKDASFLQQSAFWPFKVIQGRWFWCQLKACMWLPISQSLWLWSYLAPFLRYGDLLTENCLFFLPLSHSAPSLPMFPLEFRAEVYHEKTRVLWGYPTVKTAWL